MKADAPFVRDLLLVGAGHSSVQVLKSFGMKPEPGVRITVIAREPHTPYSGMLPGFLAGKYTYDEIHIDVLKLATFAQARFIGDEVTRVNLAEKTVSLKNRPDVRYDVLAINTGGSPGIHFQNHELVVSVKPIGRFIPAWEQIVEKYGRGKGCRLAIVGGGPGSVEVALAVREHHGDIFDVTLVTADEEPLSLHNRRIRKIAYCELKKQQIDVLSSFFVKNISEHELIAEDGRRLSANCVLWVGGVEAPAWIRESGFAVDGQGFLRVNKQLQSVSDACVFAAGDMVSLDGQQRPKSGVFAVREGPILAINTRYFLTDRALVDYDAQRQALAILRVPDDRAIATKGPFCVRSKSILSWKDWIDRQFMKRFSDLPPMEGATVANVATSLKVDQPELVRCGGCGSKLGADLLERVLRRLADSQSSEYLVGLGDDAAVVEWNSSRLITSVDGFRAMITDPFQFGRLSAHHALNDLYAMGSTPQHALALVTVPLMSDTLMEEDLYQTMAGALSVFEETKVKLVGGHSAEGTELSLGFAVTGTANQPISNSSLKPDQALILNKPLGTGLLLAGVMEGSTQARDYMEATSIMDQSNATAANIFVNHHASAMTDITGFGLLGHTLEMVRRSGVNVDISVEAIHLMGGVKNAVHLGVRSSLHDNNWLALQDFETNSSVSLSNIVPLVDPQTCGGLVAAVPIDSANDCIEQLKEEGYVQASQIGRSTTDPVSRLI